ncbi:hypothetical protein yc1106_07696 [Curvularia clavata]|uniref:Alpha-L-rhamnosidase C-terminal domain-containing protein n=1 Tax=Curvularia clavata TaxID=95742 RepID=A0A9Q9DV32_CURCL|nr:hypothetical protein yc1106_07696 [Curvularia clavata]
MRCFELSSICLAWYVVCFAASVVGEQHIYAKSKAEKADDIIYGSKETITLSGLSAVTAVEILDYGVNVEKFPTFEVVSVSGDVSGFEIRYSETRDVLEAIPGGDGPVAFVAAMDTYRVNIYSDIAGPTRHENRLIQGGFRYQELRLTTAGKIVLNRIGVRPMISNIPVTSLPGSFDCSDKSITQIWRTGARTIQLNQIPANSIPPFWNITPEGSYVSSQAPQSRYGPAFTSLSMYEMWFDVKPIIGGFSFSVLADTLNTGIYIWFNLANGTVSANAGATEATSDFLASATLAANVTFGEWHNVNAKVNHTDIDISIDGFEVLRFNQTSSFYGSFGMGAVHGQSAIFKNLKVSTFEGASIYSSPLTDTTFLSDFLMGTNPLDTIVDGSKRDRIAYTGDLDIAVGVAMVSTYGLYYVQGTLDLFASYQLTPGFFVPNVKIQQRPRTEPIEADITGLIGYSFNLLCAVSRFYQLTGDLELAKTWAPRIIRMLNWADCQTLPNGLFNVSNPSFGGDWNHYDPPQSGVSTNFNMIYAYALQSSLPVLADAGFNKTVFSSRLHALRTSINSHLWNDDLDVYHISESIRDGYGQDSNTLAILAGVTGAIDKSSRVLRSLNKLSTIYGPLAFSEAAVTAGFRNLISPYASAYHLRAAFLVGDGGVAKTLLQTLWNPMANPTSTNYTGCFWEVLSADGGPGLGEGTSLCHAWGAGPTGELSTYVLGIQPMKPGFSEWLVSPVTMGLSWAYGTIPVPNGTINVSWNATNEAINHIEVEAPAGTRGIIQLPAPVNPCSQVWYMNGRPIAKSNTRFEVHGGKAIVLSFR